MLIPTATFPGHVGPPIAPGALWTSWNTDPLVWLGLVATGVAYLWASSRRHDDVARHRRRYFLAALATLLVALVSPLDAMGVSLSSAHMVQHLLLTSVAAPLIVLAAPVRTASAALSPQWRLVARAGRRSRPAQLGRAVLARPRHLQHAPEPWGDRQPAHLSILRVLGPDGDLAAPQIHVTPSER